ncbi:hypothetical protein [Pseudonocardia sp. GCM10023141]|uniref:hypothetical protein n=1 Tax=Pseudonocardia sp. GCM10023141 TaxID=3252653 RepID=UPI003609A8E2
MTTSRGAVRSIWDEGRWVERVAYVLAAVLFASGVVHLGVLVVSGGSWEGPLSLRKPTTFGLSFGVTLASVAWATSYLTVRSRVRNLLLGLFIAASVVETVLVSMQAWRGVPSHFNFETGFDNAVSMTLAAGGGVIILVAVGFAAAAVVGVGAITPSMRVALRAGFGLLLVALGAGAVMIATGVVEARGGNPQLAYDTAGALKPLHFVAMHGILVLPGLAWLLRFDNGSERRRTAIVGVGAIAYAVLTAVVGVESATGVSPLAAPPLQTSFSVAALVVLLGCGGFAMGGALHRDGAAVRA